MTNAELLDLLREARKFVVDAERLWIEWDNEQEERAVVSMLARIDAALAEPLDSATPVVEWRNDGFGRSAVVGNAGLRAWAWKGVWAWSCERHSESTGVAKSEDEAKSAAIAAARGLK